MSAVDARVDASRAEARARAAAQYGTPGLQQQLRGAGRDPEFDAWRAHRAVVTPVLVPYSGEAPPPDTLNRAYRAVTVRGTAAGEDGWQAPVAAVTVFCTLTGSADAGWKVSSIDIA
jgi:hypothetical protein